MAKQRLDVYLAENKIVRSRSEAQSIIKAGGVLINGKIAVKAGESVDGSEKIEIKNVDGSLNYVSRGGAKLEKALKVFGASPKDKVCMDIGASTGGFTDCMLKNGAKFVYAVDVGTGQLAEKLKNDSRVVNMEKTNIRYLTKEDLNVNNNEIEFFSVDVSFISLDQVLPAIFLLTAEEAEGVCLIKPQFEAGKDKIGKKGVVRDKKVHIEVIKNVLGYIENHGFVTKGIDFSPIKGPEGNIEYLAYIKKKSKQTEKQIEINNKYCDTDDEIKYKKIDDDLINKIISMSHSETI